MAEVIEIIILSAIQGISEFIPVSSSAHLYLMSEVQNFEIKSLLTDVSLHLGSLLAIPVSYTHLTLPTIYSV